MWCLIPLKNGDGDLIMGRFDISPQGKRDLTVFIIMLSIVLIGFFLRTYYIWTPAIQSGFGIFGGAGVSGGADSYYHERVIYYIVSTGHQLTHDPLLNYPVGFIDPRPPFYEWAVIGIAYIFLPFAGNMMNALGYSMMLITAIFGALIAIPIYLIGKEAFNRRVGIISALLIATSASNMMRSVASWNGYDDVILFFAVWTFYFFIKALKSVNRTIWVDNYFSLSSWKNGTIKFFRENKLTVIYSALAGVSFGTIQAMWQGFAYVEAIILIYLIFQIFFNKIRNVSSFHILWITIIFGIFSYPLGFPYFYVTHMVSPWMSAPFYLLLFVIIATLFFEFTQKWPWTFTYTIVIILAIGAFVFLKIYAPGLINYALSGAGYFIKTPMYMTIAEAQSPTLGQLIMNASVGVFFLFVAGLFFMLYDIRKNRNEYYLFFVIFSLVSVFMAFSAARFIYNASPGFIIPAAYMLDLIVTKLNLEEIGKTFRAFNYSVRVALRKSIKWSKIVAIILIALFVITPNMWGAVDSAIPYNNKTVYDKQIYNVMPSFYRPQNYTGLWYLGAYGVQITTKQDDPWQNALIWLSTQDTNQASQYRPAFISWWDYGFQEILEGQHPTVADNFQNGYQIAGQFLTTQNESKAISLLIARILDAALYNSSMANQVENILIQYLGPQEEKNILNYYFNLSKNPSYYINLVLSNPQKYGNYTNNLTTVNAKYALVKGDLSQYPENVLVNLYLNLERVTGYSIEYFGVDYRLFPLSGTQTGIFYAPAFLSDRPTQIINGQFIPTEYYNILAEDSSGNTYPLNAIPPNVQIVNYVISYKPAFFNTMLYRAYVGYSGLNVGIGPYIPGLSSQMNYYPIMPAWNLTHFEVVYSTSFWNPYKDYQNHTNAWKAVPLQEAYYLQQTHNGTVVLFPPGNQILPANVVIVKFYPGAIIQGRVTLSDGQPLSNVLVTLDDQYGIPHTYTYTNSSGYYTLYAVAGNDTIIISTNGNMNKLFLSESTILNETKIYVSEDQALRINTGIQPNGNPGYIITKNFIINASNIDGMVYYNIMKNNTYTKGDYIPYGSTVYLKNTTYSLNYSATVSKSGYYKIENIAPHKYDIIVNINGSYYYVGNVTINPQQNLTHDIVIYPDKIMGTVSYQNGTAAKNVTVRAYGKQVYETKTDQYGSYTLYVLPGSYRVNVEKSGYYSSYQVASFSSFNSSSTVNFNILKGYTLNGTVLLNNKPVPGAIVRFTDEFTYQNSQVVVTNSSGQFSLTLPEMYYSIYIDYFYNNAHYVYIGYYVPMKNSSLMFNLTKAVEFSGYVNYGRYPIPDSGVILFSGQNFVRVYTNNSGYFSVYVPPGNYNLGVVGFNSSTSVPYAYYTKLNILGNTFYNVSLENARSVSGQVMANSLIITHAVVFLEYDNQNYYVNSIQADGKFHFYVTENGYSFSAFSYAYTMKNIVSNINYTINMVPVNVNVYGKVDYPSAYKGNIELVFRSNSGTYYANVSNNVYSVLLPPGNYSLSVITNNTESYAVPSEIYVNYNTYYLQENINIKVFARVSIANSLNNIYWFNTQGKLVNSGNNISIEPGTYTLYTFGGNLVYLGKYNITENSIIYLSYIYGNYVSINIKNYSKTVDLNIKYGNVVLIKPVQTFTELILPGGYYTFSIENIVEGKIPYVYQANNSTYVSGNTTVNLYVKGYQYLSNIHGYVYYNSNSLPWADVILYNNSTYFNAPTDSSGFFNISIPPGYYTVYVYYPGYSASYLGHVNVNMGESIPYNIYLQKGYNLNIYITYSNRTYSGNATLISNNSYFAIKFTNGFGSINLPMGYYTINASAINEEYGMNVEYYTNYTINLTGSTNINIQMSRNTIHDIKMVDLSPTLTGNVGENLTYVISVKNSGNIPENVTFESTGPWNVSFSQKNMEIYPGESRILKVNVTVSDKMNLGDNTIEIRGIYNQSQISFTNIVLNVTVYHNTTIENPTTMVISGDSVILNFTILNHGNSVEKYNVTILNNVELRSLGWNYTIENNNITVGPWGQNTLTIKLTPISSTHALKVNVIVAAFSANREYTTEYTMNMVYIQPLQGIISNGNVTYVIPNISLFLTEVIIVTVVIITGFMLFLTFTRRKRK